MDAEDLDGTQYAPLEPEDKLEHAIGALQLIAGQDHRVSEEITPGLDPSSEHYRPPVHYVWGRWASTERTGPASFDPNLCPVCMAETCLRQIGVTE